MDRYTRDNMLRTEGINGLMIISRNKEMRTKRPFPYEITGKENGDLRRYNSFGAIIPVEDYMIIRDGALPIVIREVQPEARVEHKGKRLRKYAILEDEKGTFEYPTVRYIYSEGIDFEKMAEDAEYARAVRSLVDERRLQDLKQEASRLGSSTVYIGTVTKTDKGYEEAGADDFVEVITKIDYAIQEQNRKVAQQQAETMHKRETARKTEELGVLLKGTTPEQVRALMYKMFDHICDQKGKEGLANEIVAATREYVKLKEEQQNNPTAGNGHDDDDEPTW